MKFVVGALAAVAFLVGVAASQPAEARCYWNGYAWVCWHHPHRYWHHHHWGWDRQYWHRWAW